MTQEPVSMPDPFATPPAGAPAYATPPTGAPEYPAAPVGAPMYAAPPSGAPAYPAPPMAPPGYPAPGYAAYPPQYGNPTPKNWMGIVSLITSITTPITGIGAIAGIVFGHLGLAAVKRGEANNRGMTLAGLIIGYVMFGLGALGVIAYIGFVAWAVTSDPGGY